MVEETKETPEEKAKRMGEAYAKLQAPDKDGIDFIAGTS